MPRNIHDVFKVRHFRCPKGHQHKDLWWGQADPPICPICDEPTSETGPEPANKSAFVHGDECDVLIRHGLCHEDGTPKRYTSKEQIRRDAYEAGYTQGTDTPKPNPRIVEQRAREAEARKERSKYR